MQLLPGQGPPDSTRRFGGAGLSEVKLQFGQYLNNLLGVGGTGPSLAVYTCDDPTHVVTGLEVAWEPAPTPPSPNIATGVRVHCGASTSCEEGGVAAPAPAATQ